MAHYKQKLPSVEEVNQQWPQKYSFAFESVLQPATTFRQSVHLLPFQL
jgi:hypothetical protein